jgi:hypothetical protein
MRGALLRLLLITVFLSGCAQKTEATKPAETAPAETAAAEIPSSMPAVDACAALTQSEIEKSFGSLKEGPSPATGASGEKQCKYSNMNGSWLQVSLYGTDRWEFQKGMLPSTPKPLPGLGDEAFSIKRGTDSVVYVRKGGGIVEVSCSCALTEAEALAAIAAGRI